MRSGKKRMSLFLPLLLTLLAVLVAACGGNGSGATGGKLSDDKQIYVDASQTAGLADLATLDPAISTDAPSISAIDMMFTGLVQLNDKLEVYGELAQSWSTSKDGLTWTFKLRPGLKFSDGNPITADDVVFSIDRALKPELKSVVSPSYLGLVKDAGKRNAGKIPTLIGDSLFAPDPSTVKIVTSSNAQYFLDALTYTTSYVVEKSFVQKYGDTAFLKHLSEGGCSGPFKLDQYNSGKYASFVPNTNYWGPKPQLKKVVLPFYKDPQTAYKAFKTNQLDLANVPATNRQEALALPNKQYRQVPQLTIDYFTMNYLAKPFDNIKIRQAFALALDKDAIEKSINKGSRLATNHIVPQGMPGYYADLKGPAGVTSTKGDKDMAKQLLQEGMKEAGYTTSNFPAVTMTVASNGSSAAKNLFEFAQQQWKDALGITVTINDEDFNKRVDDINNAVGKSTPQMWFAAWGADYPDAQDWTTLLFGKDSPNNSSNYGSGQNKAVQLQNQELMLKADVNQNNAQRLAQYNQVEQQLINDAAWIPVDQRTLSYVLKPCVQGVVDNAQDQIPPQDWANVYKTSDSGCANTDAYK